MRTKLLSLLVILFMGVTFVSCSKDDDGDDNVMENLVGTWMHTFSGGYQLVTFQSNGTGTLIEVDFEDEDYEDTFIYSYNANNQTLKIYWEKDDYEEWQLVSITSKELVLMEDGEHVTFTKQ